MPERPSGGPHIVVLSSLFPSQRQPGAGLFIRERMFRVGQRLPLAVVAPTPWFPFQDHIRRWWPNFRPGAPRYEQQQGFDVWFPRFFSFPGAFKRLDGWLMALGAFARVRALHRAGRLHVLDAHFAYPDGYAAAMLGRWFKVPVTITLRGTEERHARDPVLGPLMATALNRASRIFAVSESLRRIAIAMGQAPDRVKVIGNGVDLGRFRPIDKVAARAALGLPEGADIMVSVGGLCERKGFHRVMEILPQLLQSRPNLHYVIVGGPSPEGDWTERLRQQASDPLMQDRVHFTGPIAADGLPSVLSAADIFVLATRNEGWANVFLEAMACGLPVVTTNVGGNSEVVAHGELGRIVPFGDSAMLGKAILQALRQQWDRGAIRAYAEANTWECRVDILEAEFVALSHGGAHTARQVNASATEH